MGAMSGVTTLGNDTGGGEMGQEKGDWVGAKGVLLRDRKKKE